MSLFEYCWSTNEALVVFLIGHYLLLHSFESSLSFLWLQLCDSLLSLAEFLRTRWKRGVRVRATKKQKTTRER